MQLLDTIEAASRVKLSVPTLETYRSRGLGPVYVKYRHAVRYRIEDLDSWVAGRIVKPGAERVA